MSRRASEYCGCASGTFLFVWLAVATLQAGSPLDWRAASGHRFAELPKVDTGPTGFLLMDPRNTGITFTNRLPVRSMMDNNNLMNGSGVAAGDFDGDGWCDLYFCAIDGTNALYRNLGGWRFEDVTQSMGVGCPGLHSTGAVFADIDGDGRLDLLVATLGSGVHAFINEDGKRFRESTREAGLASSTGSTSLALADVDGDGTLDLYVANYGAVSFYRSGGRAQMKNVNGRWVFEGSYAERLRFIDGRIEELGEADVLYLNDGHGHFRPVPWNSEYFLDEDGKPMPPPLDFGLTVQMRDLNGDGAPDIYVCNDFKTVDRIWLNDGTGRFRALPRLAMRKQSFSSMGVDFADIDRDGFLDLFTTEMIPRRHGRRLQDLVTMQPNIPVPGRIDNRPEVARNVLFRNRGDGTFAEIAYYGGVAATEWSWEPVFLDVDLDGYEDLLIGTGMWFDVQDRDTLNRIRRLGSQTPEQSRTNLALYPPYLTPAVAFRNRHDLTFEDMSRSWGFDAVRVAQGIALADLDHDGGMDVVVNCLNDAPLVYRNRASAPRIAVRLHGKAPNWQGVGAKVRVVGGPVSSQMQEIVCGGRYLSGDELVRVFAAGHPTNRLEIEVVWRNGTQSRVPDAQPNRIYEIDQAGAAPLTRRDRAAPKPPPLFRDVSHLLGHSHHEDFYMDYARQPLLMRQLSQWGPGVAWADLDHDGREELLVGAAKGGYLEAFRYQDPGSFGKVSIAQAGPVPDDLCGMALWATAEGRQGLLVAVANYESDPPRTNAVLQCSAISTSGGYELSPFPGVANWEASPGPLAVADIDGDGVLEVFVGGRMVRGAYPQATASKIYRQARDKLVPDTTNEKLFESVGLVSGAVWSDLDGDGFPELILACEWGSLKIYKNDHGRLHDATAGWGLDACTGWWTGVTTGDFDEDGRLDIIAGNWGLNDAYQASAEHPLRLYYGNLNGLGTIDLIEGYYDPELGTEVPRRTLNALGQAFPVLLERFPSHEAFGKATLNQVLAALPYPAQSLAANTLQTMVFLNRGSHFEARSLPAEAQFAPVFAVNVADADGDGHEDIFLSQNFFAVRPECHRLDGGRGLWLRGDGKGGFTPIPGQESGVEVYGEQRGAALGDFNADGRVDLAVTQSGAATRLFENTGARPGLRVRLKGPAGNPLGIGAILRLESNRRLGPAREVHGGSGYWSQDSTVQVLGCPAAADQIHVLWPGGRTTRTDLPPAAREVTVRADGTLAAARGR
jgi:enediyne biosynthesis protein E4